MKKLSIILSFLMIAAVFFVSCDNKTSAPPTEYKVTFDPDNGDEKTVVTVKEGETATKPEKDPVKENTVAFVAWIKDDGTAYNFEDKVTSDLTLKATYRTTAVVTFVNGETKTTKEVEYGKTVNKPADEVKREVGGFASWRNEKNEIYDFSTPVTSDITLTASVWKEITQTDDVFDEGVAAYMLASEFANVTHSKSGQAASGDITLSDSNLKDIIVYSLGRADFDKFVGYMEHEGVKYYTGSGQDSSADLKYLYCEITSKENYTVGYDAAADPASVTAKKLTISAKFSEGEKGSSGITKKGEFWEENPVTVVISGVDEIVDEDTTSYRFNYTLTKDNKTNLFYVESSVTNDNAMILTYSNQTDDYLWKYESPQQQGSN